MNGFALHGIDHLSASSLNQWVSEPGVFAIERLLRLRSPTSPAMARGKAAEDVEAYEAVQSRNPVAPVIPALQRVVRA